MFIYVNGDSFAAGAGLHDSHFVDNYESYLTPAGKVSINEYHVMRTDTINRKYPNRTAEVNRHERELSYPALLGKYLGAEVMNSAQPGSSMTSILYRTMMDLNSLKSQNKVPDHVIIHITSPERITMISEMGMANAVEDFRWILSFVSGFDFKSDYQIATREILRCQNAREMLVKYMLELSLINSVIRDLTGKLPILTATTNHERFQAKKLSLVYPLLETLIADSRIETIPIELIEGSHLTYGAEVTLPCGHFGPDTVNRFAQALSSYIGKLNAN